MPNTRTCSKLHCYLHVEKGEKTSLDHLVIRGRRIGILWSYTLTFSNDRNISDLELYDSNKPRTVKRDALYSNSLSYFSLVDAPSGSYRSIMIIVHFRIMFASIRHPYKRNRLLLKYLPYQVLSLLFQDLFGLTSHIKFNTSFLNSESNVVSPDSNSLQYFLHFLHHFSPS